MNANSLPLGRLGELPAEIRNEIYKYALTTTASIEVSRFRRPDPKKAPKPSAAPEMVVIKVEYGPRCKIEVQDGQKKRKLPPGEVLAFGLLHKGKTIYDEAVPILYGVNHFDFASASSVEVIVCKIGARASLLANVSFPVLAYIFKDEGVACLSAMADPRNIVVRKDDVGLEASATISAAETWFAITISLSSCSLNASKSSNAVQRLNSGTRSRVTRRHGTEKFRSLIHHSLLEEADYEAAVTVFTEKYWLRRRRKPKDV